MHAHCQVQCLAWQWQLYENEEEDEIEGKIRASTFKHTFYLFIDELNIVN